MISDLEKELLEFSNSSHLPYYHKIQYLSSVYNEMAEEYWEQGDFVQAKEYWNLSFETYPYLHWRNANVGIKMLTSEDLDMANKFLSQYITDWLYGTCQGEFFPREEKVYPSPVVFKREIFDVDIVKTLAVLLEQNKLENNPMLIGIYYFLLRNTIDILYPTVSFSKLYLHILEEYEKKYPNHSLLSLSIGNTYFLDLEQYGKAFEAYKKCFFTTEKIPFLGIKRFITAATNIKKDPFEDISTLELRSKDLPPGICYNMGNAFSEAYDKYENSDKIFFKIILSKRCFWFQEAYKKFTSYFIDKDYSFFHNNQPHCFGMTCNNYSIYLNELTYIDSVYVDKDIEKECLAIRIAGYQFSQFIELFTPMIEHSFDSENYKQCLSFRSELESQYIDSLSLSFFRANKAYLYFIKSAIFENLHYYEIEEIYSKVRQYFISNWGNERDETDDDNDEESYSIGAKYFVRILYFYSSFLLQKKYLKEVEAEIVWIEEYDKKILSHDLFTAGDLYLLLANYYDQNFDSKNALEAYKKSLGFFLKTNNKEKIIPIKLQISKLIKIVYPNIVDRFFTSLKILFSF